MSRRRADTPPHARSLLPLIVALAVLTLGSMVLAGCHDAPAGRPTQQQAERLPVEPQNEPPPVGPALFDTVRPWDRPSLPGQADWQLATAPLRGTDVRVTYRVPFSWDVDSRGRARSADGHVRVVPALTPVSDEELSLASYIAQLAEEQPIYSRTTDNGYTAYIVERKVSVAPSDPNVAQRYYHTAIVDVRGQIIKLDVIYDAALRWRFREVANAIVGTMDVQETPFG